MKWLWRLVTVVVVFVVVAVGALFLIPKDRIVALAAERFEAATGRALTVSGPVGLTVWPRIGLEAEGIAIANAPWSDAGPMVEAEALDIGVDVIGLIGGNIRVTGVELIGAVVRLERNGDGRGNWEIAAPAASGGGSNGATSANGGTSSPALTVDSLVVTESAVLWRDATTDSDLSLTALDLSTALTGWDDPVAVTMSALLGGQPVESEMRIDALGPFLDGALTGVSGTVTAGETAVGLDGRADLDPVSFAGQVNVTSTNGFAALAGLGITPPDLPAGLGRDRVAVTSDVTLAPEGTLHLREMVAELDQTRIAGDLDLLDGAERPKVSGSLSINRLDLAAASGGSGGSGSDSSGSAAPGVGSPWGSDVIDTSGLFAADADLVLTSGPLVYETLQVDRMSARLTVDAGRAVLALQSLAAYGGTVTGDVVLNGRGGVSARAQLRMDGLQLQPLTTALADFDRLVGQADLSVDLLGAGNTPQALVESLDGRLAVTVGRGEILGLDIPGMVRNFDLGFQGEGQKTVFDSLSARFDVTDGVARGDDLSLQAPFLTVGGEGRIDLGPQTIRYRLIPTLRRGADSDGITVPLFIEGPWADPTIRPDLEFLARQRFDAEREELEARAREEVEEARERAEDRLRERLAEELDVAPEGLTGRDAIEDAVRDRVGDTLRGLFNR